MNKVKISEELHFFFLLFLFIVYVVLLFKNIFQILENEIKCGLNFFFDETLYLRSISLKVQQALAQKRDITFGKHEFFPAFFNNQTHINFHLIIGVYGWYNYFINCLYILGRYLV